MFEYLIIHNNVPNIHAITFNVRYFKKIEKIEII